VEIKTEGDSNDITECPHDDKPTTGMFGLSDAVFSTCCITCSAVAQHCVKTHMQSQWRKPKFEPP